MGSSAPFARVGNALIWSGPGKGLPQPVRKNALPPPPQMEGVRSRRRCCILVDETGEARQILGHGETVGAKIGQQHRHVCRYVLGKHLIY